MLLCAFSSEAPEAVGAPIVGQESAFGCFAQDETLASAGVSAARERERGCGEAYDNGSGQGGFSFT